MSYKGDPKKGAAAYDKAFCSSCHRFGPLGNEVGPDLTTVGKRFRRQDLVEAILYPSRTISDLWAAEQVVTQAGDTLIGTVAREDLQMVVLTTPAGERVSLAKAGIRARSRSKTSPMPEGLLHNLSREEIIRLLLFLEAGPEAIPDSSGS